MRFFQRTAPLAFVLLMITAGGCTGFGVKDRAYVFSGATQRNAGFESVSARTAGAEGPAAAHALSAMTFNMKHKNRAGELEAIAGNLRSELASLPDFVLCQEVIFGGDDGHTANAFAAELGYHAMATKRTTDREGLGIVSRYPFVYYAERHLDAQTSSLLIGFRRVSVMGEFDVPGVGLVRVVNTHLTNWGFEGHIRRKQIAETLAWIDERDQAVPAAMTILGGDFNAERTWNEMKWLAVEGKVKGETVVFRDFNSEIPSFGAPGRPRIRVDFLFVAARDRAVVLAEERVLWKEGLHEADGDHFYPSDHLAVLHQYRLVSPPSVTAQADQAMLGGE